MPCETRALDPYREFPNAREHRQLPEILHRLIWWSCDDVMETFEEGAGLTDRVSLDGVGHERCRCLRNGTTAPLKRDIRDHITIDLHVEIQPIAAEWIVALGAVRRRFDRAEVPRPLVMVEDHFLIQVAEIRHLYSLARGAPPPLALTQRLRASLGPQALTHLLAGPHPRSGCRRLRKHS